MNSDSEQSHESTAENQNESVPGALQGEVWLTIQTYQAQSLIRGRRAVDGKPAIMGLIGFADRLKSLWQAVRFDDPYADWWLLKVEEGVADIRAQLQGLQQRMDALITESNSAFEFTVAQSSRPQRVSLQFANPYAFRAAQLLGEYDRLMCTDMTLPQGYHSLDVRRHDIRQGTPAAIKARERMGEIPQDILNGERLPSLRPLAFQQKNSNAIADSDET